MLDWLEEIINNFRNHEFPILIDKLKKIIGEFSLHYVSEIKYLIKNPDILDKIKESKVITINHLDQANLKYLIIVFEKIIIIIPQFSFYLLKNLFSNGQEKNIYFFQGSKVIFEKNIEIKYIESKNIFQCPEICKTTRYPILKRIMNSIFQYLLDKSYFKTCQKNRIKDYYNFKPEKLRIYKEEDYIELNINNLGSNFRAKSIYLFEKEEILIIKEPLNNTTNISTLIKREINNYEKLNHPLISKIYGKTNTETNYAIIEYINGETLLNIDMNKLTEREKLTIIFEIMITIAYFHRNKMILRDLKPNNIIIDHNKTAVFIDFDHLRNFGEINNEQTTKDFASIYCAPELQNGSFSYECDIYSLGKIIYFIMTSKYPYDYNIEKLDGFDKHPKLKEIIKNCTKTEINERKNIFTITKSFLNDYQDSINDIYDLNDIFIEYAYNFNHPKLLYNIGYYYLLSPNEIRIKKAIHYFTKAANMNNADAQNCLGLIYESSKYTIRDIDKAIHYYKLAAEQNHVPAQFNLGNIYYCGNDNQKNIESAIHYFEMAAKHHYVPALNNLGCIYFDGKDVKQNINKSIKYYSLAADQNCPEAQYNLGLVYEEIKNYEKMIFYFELAANQNFANAQNALAITYHEGKYVKKDINKAIHYYILAANQNHPIAQYNLGCFYHNGQYVPKNYEKAFNYWQLSANQNYPKSWLNLGCLYYHGQYVSQDIAKSIHYFTLAANHNVLEAQNYLGMIYSGNKLVPLDIKKAIHYFNLAASQNDSNSQYSLGYIYYNGEHVTKNIDLAIHYFTLAANQNDATAQFLLGIIYKEKNDINNSIYYLYKAANQNYAEAQFSLGLFYHEGKNIDKDIDKAIYYYTLAAKQHHPSAAFNLGSIYLLNKYVKRDINKAISYLSIASDYNHSEAQNNLGVIYYEGKYVPIQLNKSFHYFSLASKQNNSNAQKMIGLFYLLGLYVNKNVEKGIDYLIQSEEKYHDFMINFVIGFYYHDKNIEKSIYYYRKASSGNSFHAKNNLGIIFKNGFGTIEKNVGRAISYFEDSIRIERNTVAMYNLAHTYIYEDVNNNRIDTSIELLTESLSKNFLPAEDLLCIAIVKKCGFDIENIRHTLHNKLNQKNICALNIYEKIQKEKLFEKSFYEEKFKYYKTIDFLYDILRKPILSTSINKKESDQSMSTTLQNITNDFYEGFGL